MGVNPVGQCPTAISSTLPNFSPCVLLKALRFGQAISVLVRWHKLISSYVKSHGALLTWTLSLVQSDKLQIPQLIRAIYRSRPTYSTVYNLTRHSNDRTVRSLCIKDFIIRFHNYQLMHRVITEIFFSSSWKDLKERQRKVRASSC